jgi:hypothetical protein
MPEELPTGTIPFTLDQGRLDTLFDRMQTSCRNCADDNSKALDKSIDMNKQLSAFYERLLLLDTGMIGISASALLSFGSKAGSLGHTKYLIVVLVALGWAFLLLSIILCRSIMMHCLVANQLLYKEWRKHAIDFHGSFISGDVARISTAMRGSIDVDGKPVDATIRFNELAQMVKEKFEESKRLISAESTATEAPETRAEGARAIQYMQLALLLLGTAAITLLIKM